MTLFSLFGRKFLNISLQASLRFQINSNEEKQYTKK